MNFHNAVEHAIKNANPEDPDEFREPPSEYIKALPDEADLPVEPDEGDAEYEVTVLGSGDVSVLRPILAAYCDIEGYQLPPESYFLRTEQHEGRHIKAARMLGATSIRVGVLFQWRTVSGEKYVLAYPFMRTVNFATTKLGSLLVTAHPADLSEGDRVKIAQHDRTVEGLARKAVLLNQEAGKTIYPVPLSTTEVWI